MTQGTTSELTAKVRITQGGRLARQLACAAGLDVTMEISEIWPADRCAPHALWQATSKVLGEETAIQKPGRSSISFGRAVTRAKLVRALMFPCSSMIDSITGAMILALLVVLRNL